MLSSHWPVVACWWNASASHELKRKYPAVLSGLTFRCRDGCQQRGSPIGLAGCGIWLFFAVIFGICAENRGGKWELQIRAGAGFRVFMGLGREIRMGNRAGYNQRKNSELAEIREEAYKRTFCAYSCVRFQVITRAFQRKRPSWNFGFVFFFFVQPQFAIF